MYLVIDYRLSVKQFVCLFDLILYFPSTIFQLCRDGSSLVEPVKARINVFCSRTQLSDTSEAPNHGPSVSSQAFYHWATALPSNSLDPAGDQCFVEHDLCPNCLQILSADDKSRTKRSSYLTKIKTPMVEKVQ